MPQIVRLGFTKEGSGTMIIGSLDHLPSLLPDTEVSSPKVYFRIAGKAGSLLHNGLRTLAYSPSRPNIKTGDRILEVNSLEAIDWLTMNTDDEACNPPSFKNYPDVDEEEVLVAWQRYLTAQAVAFIALTNTSLFKENQTTTSHILRFHELTIKPNSQRHVQILNEMLSIKPRKRFEVTGYVEGNNNATEKLRYRNCDPFRKTPNPREVVWKYLIEGVTPFTETEVQQLCKILGVKSFEIHNELARISTHDLLLKLIPFFTQNPNTSNLLELIERAVGIRILTLAGLEINSMLAECAYLNPQKTLSILKNLTQAVIDTDTPELLATEIGTKPVNTYEAPHVRVDMLDIVLPRNATNEQVALLSQLKKAVSNRDLFSNPDAVSILTSLCKTNGVLVNIYDFKFVKNVPDTPNPDHVNDMYYYAIRIAHLLSLLSGEGLGKGTKFAKFAGYSHPIFSCLRFVVVYSGPKDFTRGDFSPIIKAHDIFNGPLGANIETIKALESYAEEMAIRFAASALAIFIMREKE